MFDRTVVRHCQKNLACRLLHLENVMNVLKNDVECDWKSVPEIAYTENIHDVKSQLFSSIINSLGYKIASKMFEFFI